MKYVIASRELSGTSSQVVVQLDELIVALMAMRHALVGAPGADQVRPGVRAAAAAASVAATTALF